jgi:hypothetical protein
MDHLVVSNREHRPQVAGQALDAMLSIVADSEGRSMAFYNGPACGASAPDHIHFQVCPGNGMPLPHQVVVLARSNSPRLEIIDQHADGDCYTGTLDGRGFFACLTGSAAHLQRRLAHVLAFLQARSDLSAEPPINLMIAGLDSGYIGILLPRRAHRPACFYRQDSGRMVVSPGAVDVGGLVIMPRQQDFERVDSRMLLQIFAEVCWGQEIFDGLEF